MAIISLKRRPPESRRSGTFQRIEHGPSLTGSGATLNLRSKSEARRVRQLRQGWQQDAWAYRDTIGEIRYAVEFKAHCAARMRLFPAIYPQGRWDDSPIPMVDPITGPVPDLPPAAILSAQNALNQLGTGREAIAEMMASLSSNFSVAGEAYFVGQQDPYDGSESWAVRSVDELMIRNDQYAIREVPLDPQGVFGWIDLDPDTDYVSRVWNSHPRFRILPDSPMRAILDDCESLLILRRTIRATGRSRLAGAGLLLLPEGLEVETSTEDNQDGEAQPFLAKLGEAMMEPIGDEGTASAVVPILVRGTADALKEVRQLFLDRALDPISAAQRTELVGVIATGFDLPKEVIVGMADLNHWTAWQVDDNTFRHHVEPHVVDLVTAITVGYLRVAMIADGIDPEIVGRSVVWYDPTELLTHPDRTADAIQLYTMKELSGDALRRVTGFDEEDKPEPLEIVQRAIGNTRTYPANALLAILGRLDPTLTIPPILAAGTIPGLKGGMAIGVPPPVVPVPGGPIDPAIGGQDAPIVPPTPAVPASGEGPPSTVPPALAAAAGRLLLAGLEPTEENIRTLLAAEVLTAAASQEHIRLSQKLASIDADLRARLQVAANAAMLRVLDRAGAKLRTKVQQSRQPEAIPFKALLRPVPNARAGSVVGQAIVGSLGLTTTELTASDWSDVHAVFEPWVARAQATALTTAAKLAGIPAGDPRVATCAATQAEARKKAWEAFSAALTKRAADLLYDPKPSADPDAPWAGANPDVLVPPGMVRAALAMAGGHPHVPKELTAAILWRMSADPPGGIGTGSTISSLLTESGATPAKYEWKHGAPVAPYEPHEDLDGYQFSSWIDPGLAAPGGAGSWPYVEFFSPGDHNGCTCDFQTLWEPGSQGQGDLSGDRLGGDTGLVGRDPALPYQPSQDLPGEGRFNPLPENAPHPNLDFQGFSMCDGGAVQDIPLCTDSELDTVRAMAQDKIERCPIPSQEEVDYARSDAKSAARAGGKQAMNQARRAEQRHRIYDEFVQANGGEDPGYIPCHECGVRMHWNPEGAKLKAELNPNGYMPFDRGKIFVKDQGGSYKDENLLAECHSCNLRRSDGLLRDENVSENLAAKMTRKAVLKAEKEAKAQQEFTNLLAQVESRTTLSNPHGIASLSDVHMSGGKA